MQLLDDIVYYFRYLSTQHPDLLHNEAVGQRVFEVRDLEDAFGALRTGIKPKSFLLRLLLPTVEYRTQANGARKHYTFGLLVAKSHGRRDTDDSEVVAAMAESERIAEDYLERMVSDSRNGHPLFGSSIDQVDDLKATAEFLPLLFDGSYSGILIMFEFSNFRKIDSQACDPVEWVDTGLTPVPYP